MSTAEGELNAALEASKEAVRIANFLKEMKKVSSIICKCLLMIKHVLPVVEIFFSHSKTKLVVIKRFSFET